MKNKIKVYDLLKRWKKEKFSYVVKKFHKPELLKVGKFWAPINGDLDVSHGKEVFAIQLTSISFHSLLLEYPCTN